MSQRKRLFEAHYHVYAILNELAIDAESYLGIGVQEGECVRNVVLANPTIALTLCDTWGRTHGGTGRGSHDHVAHMLLQMGHRGLTTYLDGKSQDLIPALHPSEEFDLIYVDGDHMEEPALEDLLNCWPRCQFAMVVHDVHMYPVWSALARFLAHGDVDARDAQVMYCNGGTGTAIVYRAARV